MYSCLVLYRSNQPSLASSVLNLNLLPWISPVEVNYSSKWLMPMASTIPRTWRCHSCAWVNAMLVIACRILSPLILLTWTQLAALLAKLFSLSLSSSLIFRESYKQRMQRSAEIENWSSNIYRLALNNIVPMLKPGNPGKRDSKIVLILQKMIFDEKMTTFEYEFLNSMRRVTGVAREILKMSCVSVIIAWYFAKWAHQPIFSVIIADYLQSGCHTSVHNINTHHARYCRQIQKTSIHSNSVEESEQVASIT